MRYSSTPANKKTVTASGNQTNPTDGVFIFQIVPIDDFVKDVDATNRPVLHDVDVKVERRPFLSKRDQENTKHSLQLLLS